ncbi:DnaJ family molecular chaperone [Notoacmeibacter sp. MSK16QG-6]|uniref:J domain-containing protein n=1 Tax=Notoacmeibacter sp. MSK16QG-6 TaxID=2957982 RepID=UPI0020A128FB|nr:DnaJ family molecular chaperone [Notoacmeibacter sp. MSK16QG-6]MCP1199714.1 DnaJ family molecular chaperone [Notoacmeibacter sp. MSK16QG-6]
MNVWSSLGELIRRMPSHAESILLFMAEMFRSFFAGDPENRRKVAFSVAMIALSAKMAKADGVVTQSEVTAFQQIFEIPESETRNVFRLYELAQQDVAGFEAYASQMAELCGDGDGRESATPLTEDVLDGLFHIAKADGVLHERELDFLRVVGSIFGFSDAAFDTIAARHVSLGEADPYAVLGLSADASWQEVQRRYRELARQWHPDFMVARGVPEEFLEIANQRMAALNSAMSAIEEVRSVSENRRA